MAGRALTDGGAPVSFAAREARAERMVRADDVDVRLVEAMAVGDRQALARLYDRHAGALMALGVRMLGSRTEAEDLLHDVLLEAWRRAGDYDPARASVRTWLALRLRSRALDRLRSAARARVVSENDTSAPEQAAPEVGGTSPDRERVMAVLGELPVAQRQVLELAYFEGLSSSEIAARLTVPIGTVKSRTAAALGKLRAALCSAEAS